MLDTKRTTPIIALIGAVALLASSPALAQTAASSAAPAASSATSDAPASGAVYGGVAGGMTDEADEFIRLMMGQMMDAQQELPADA